MKQQQGFGLISTVIVGGIGVMCLLLLLKLVPVITEYMSVKNALASAVKEVPSDAAIGDFRRSFAKNAEVNDIKSIKSEDLDITRESGVVTIAASYERRVDLFSNAALVLSFDTSASSLGASK